MTSNIVLLPARFGPFCAGIWLVPLLALGGCADLSGGLVAPRVLALRQIEDCPAGALGMMQGRPFTALADITLAGPLRVLHPAQEITREVVPERLNAQVNDAGEIIRLFCG